MRTIDSFLVKNEPNFSSSPNCTRFAKTKRELTKEKLFNFNVELRVKNKPTPLALNVKGEGYSIHDTLLLEDAASRQASRQPSRMASTEELDSDPEPCAGPAHPEGRVESPTLGAPGGFPPMGLESDGSASRSASDNIGTL